MVKFSIDRRKVSHLGQRDIDEYNFRLCKSSGREHSQQIFERQPGLPAGGPPNQASVSIDRQLSARMANRAGGDGVADPGEARRHSLPRGYKEPLFRASILEDRWPPCFALRGSAPRPLLLLRDGSRHDRPHFTAERQALASGQHGVRQGAEGRQGSPPNRSVLKAAGSRRTSTRRVAPQKPAMSKRTAR